MARRVITRDKFKDKIWVKVYAPEIFNRKELGETPTFDINKIVGRTIESDVGSLLGDITKQHMKIKFKIIKTKGEEADTEFKEFELARPYIQRLVRRNTSRIDSIDDVETKDGRKIRVKSMVITAVKASSTHKYSIRKIMREIIKNKVKEYNMDALVLAVIGGHIQKEIREKAEEILPIKYVEIRKIEVKQ